MCGVGFGSILDTSGDDFKKRLGCVFVTFVLMFIWIAVDRQMLVQEFFVSMLYGACESRWPCVDGNLKELVWSCGLSRHGVNFQTPVECIGYARRCLLCCFTVARPRIRCFFSYAAMDLCVEPMRRCFQMERLACWFVETFLQSALGQFQIGAAGPISRMFKQHSCDAFRWSLSSKCFGC